MGEQEPCTRSFLLRKAKLILLSVVKKKEMENPIFVILSTTLNHLDNVFQSGKPLYGKDYEL